MSVLRKVAARASHTSSDPPLATLISLTAALFIVTIAINAAAGAGNTRLFHNRTGEISKEYPVYLTPSGGTFSIWGAIYFWLAVGIVYIVSTVFRKTDSGPIYVHPRVLGYPFFVVFLLNLSLNITWLFVWDHQNLVGSAVILILIAFTGWSTLAFACCGFVEHEAWLQSNAVWDKRFLAIGVKKGLSTYAAWTSLASAINLNVALQYIGLYDADDTSFGCILTVLILVIIFAILEIFVYPQHMLSLWPPYAVTITAATGILSNQQVLPDRIYGVVVAIVAVAAVLLVAKLGRYLWSLFRPLAIAVSNKPPSV